MTAHEELADVARRFWLIFNAQERGLFSWHMACEDLYQELKGKVEAVEQVRKVK